MHRNQGEGGRYLLPGVAVVALAATACGVIGIGGSDNGSGAFGGGDNFSIEGALAELPVEAAEGGTSVLVYVSDLVAAGEANGQPRPTGSLDRDEVVEWLGPMSGMGPSTVFVSVPLAMADSAFDLAGYRDEVGFTISEVDAVIEMQSGADTLLILAGELDPNGLANEVADGVGTIGEGDDHFVDPEARSVARPLGQPIRLGQDNGLVAMSGLTPMVEAWLDPDAVRFDADEDLTLAASILDDRGVISAVLCRCDRLAPISLGSGEEGTLLTGPELVGPHISTPFFTLAIGSRESNGEAEVVVVYVLAEASVAEVASGQIEDTFRDGFLYDGEVRIADVVTVDSLEIQDRAVVATLRFVDENPLSAQVRGWLSRSATPFSYAP